MKPTSEDLRSFAMFACVPAEGLEIFARAAEAVDVEPGQVVYEQGERGDAIYVVVEGELMVLRGADDTLLSEIGKGELFGEMSFVDMQPRSATVRAKTAAKLWRWPYPTLGEIRRSDLKAFTLLYMNLAREISRRLRRADERLAER
jgi:CRP-like cAMP-binding protein